MKNYIIPLCLLVSVLAFDSCKKKVYGCTDSKAINYDPEANENVGCVFSEDLYESFYYDSLSWVIDWNNNLARIDIYEEAITQQVIDLGIIEVFARVDYWDQWKELPEEFWIGTTVGCERLRLYEVFYEGKVRIWAHSIECFHPGTEPESIDLKIVIWK